MKYVVVDIETDGATPYNSNILSLGAVDLDNLNRTWYSEFCPRWGIEGDERTLKWLNEQGIVRNHAAPDAEIAIIDFDNWLSTLANGERVRFVADNAGFDWMFVAYYFDMYLGHNPFGFSPLSITSLYNGLVGDMRKSFKHLRGTKHTHNALDDAIGNAEALNKLRRQIKNL